VLRLPVNLKLEGPPVSVAEPLIAPRVAVIVIGPWAMPVATPVAEIVATVLSDEVHVAFEVILTWLPSE
jgi:hypothetical protein